MKNRSVFFLTKQLSAPTTSHSLHETSYGNVFSCSYVCWYSRHVTHWFMVFFTSAFMFTQYTISLAKSLAFLVLICLLCKCSSICLCNRKGYNYSFSFHGNAINHCQFMPKWQIILNVLFHFAFLCGQPCLMYDFSLWRVASCQLATCISSIYVNMGICTDKLMACMFTFMPVISLSFFSVWLFWYCQVCAGLYIMYVPCSGECAA